MSVAALAAIFTLTVAGCGRRDRLTFTDEETGRTWFPAPNGRYGLQIVQDPRQGVQEVWFRHLRDEDADTLVDRLNGPASLSWAPDSEFVVINHRDYASLHDFLLLRRDRRGIHEVGGMMDRVQELWQRLYPEPMQRMAFLGVRWDTESDDTRLMVVGIGQPGEDPNVLVRQAFWLNPADSVVRLAENPPELMSMRSPFAAGPAAAP